MPAKSQRPIPCADPLQSIIMLLLQSLNLKTKSSKLLNAKKCKTLPTNLTRLSSSAGLPRTTGRGRKRNGWIAECNEKRPKNCSCVTLYAKQDP